MGSRTGTEDHGIGQVVAALRHHFESHREVDMAFLFGSVAKGKATRRSDLDVAVHLSGGYDVGDIVSLAGELERLLGRDVDVIVLNSAPATLARTVLRGIPVVIRNRRFYVEFMLDVSREAEDFDHLTAELWELRRRRRAGLEAITNGR